MTENATPNPRRPRRVRYPKQLITLVSLDTFDEIERTATERDATKADVVRPRLELGRVLEAAYGDRREDVLRLANEAGVVEASALSKLLNFAIREADRRAAEIRAGTRLPAEITIEVE